MIIMETAPRVGMKGPPELEATRKFGKFTPETERPIRESEVKSNPFLEKMKTAWGAQRAGMFNPANIRYDYSWIVGNGIENLGVSAEDVGAFSVLLGGFQVDTDFPYKAGLFLSALMNNSKDSEFVIHTAHLGRIDCLGHRNTKNIIVDGDIGDWVGNEMEGGTITVNGNAGNHVGSGMGDFKRDLQGDAYGTGIKIEGGAILIEGHAGSCVGSHMRDGSIIVKGDVLHECGWDMKGGTITVGGNAGEKAGKWKIGGAIIVKGGIDRFAGWGMDGGALTVYGNAGLFVGSLMTDGEIHIEGGYECIADDMVHGKIFHKGELIARK